MGHLLLKLYEVGVFYLTNRRLVEHNHRLLLGLLEDLPELLLKHGAPLTELVVEEFLEDLIGVHHRLLTLVLADVAPAGLDARDSARINRVNVGFGKVEEHLTIQWPVVQLLGLDAINNLPSQRVHLFNEFGSELLHWNVR